MTIAGTVSSDQALSEFGLAAVALDTEMTRFEGLGARLESLNFESDKGMNKASELLSEIAASRERLQRGMQEMARSLERARDRNNVAEQNIAERLKIWVERQAVVERLTARFKILGESVRHLNEMVTALKQAPQSASSDGEPVNLRVQLTNAMKPLATLVEEAKNLVQEARAANMQGLERNADTLRQTLQGIHNRLNLISERQDANPSISGHS